MSMKWSRVSRFLGIHASAAASYRTHSLSHSMSTFLTQAINMVTKRSKDNDFDLYITRFLDEKGDTLLSAMLHSTDGVYEPGATDYWQKLRKSFGAEQTIE